MNPRRDRFIELLTVPCSAQRVGRHGRRASEDCSSTLIAAMVRAQLTRGDQPCLRPRLLEACRSQRGSPSRTSCGRRGGYRARSLRRPSATPPLLALKLQEDCGIDIVTDGEQSRQHFVHGFLEVGRRHRFRAQGRDGHPRRPLQGDGAERRRRAAAQGPRARGRGADRARPHRGASSSSRCRGR